MLSSGSFPGLGKCHHMHMLLGTLQTEMGCPWHISRALHGVVPLWFSLLKAPLFCPPHVPILPASSQTREAAQLFLAALLSRQWVAHLVCFSHLRITVLGSCPMSENHYFIYFVLFFILFYFIGHIPGMQKFPCQGSNPPHRNDNSRSLTHWATWELLSSFLDLPSWLEMKVCNLLFILILIYLILSFSVCLSTSNLI